MNHIFCERLKKHRKILDRTQAEMSEMLDVKRPTYGAYERGTIIPPMDKIQKLAELFRVSVDYLLGNTNDITRTEVSAIDVSHQVRSLMQYLQDNETELTLDGAILDEASRDALAASLENSLRMAHIINRKK